MDNELSLADLIDVEVLQRIQDAFSELTGMASLTTDLNGKPLTTGSNFSDFCMKYIRQTEIGGTRCEQCDQFGAHATWENGQPTTYYCHAGLIDYAAPIIADGKMVGCFIGGQVLTQAPDEERVRNVAAEIGVDEGKLVRAVRKVSILDKEKIDNAAKFLYVIASVLSDMAYGQYLALQAKEEIERAANMKSDFLANMSHEIRTPMNAVLGMAEMALREPLPPAAKEYVGQIKTSAKALLTIINDILDFSKIESGKMDIIPIEYEPLSILNNVCNMIITRLKDKDVELILDISPLIPCRLFGDNIRIEQVLLNLVNNAVKFTSKGQVVVRVFHEEGIGDEIILHVLVEDTGTGIKQEDLDKIFQSFQQVDSKRNRNIEGTGLGLAISRRLMDLMNGTLEVESEYGKGSTFSFTLPQKVINPERCIQVKEPHSIIAIGMMDNPALRQQLQTDCMDLEIEYWDFTTVEEISNITTEKSMFLFVERETFTAELEEYMVGHPSVTVVLVVDYDDTDEYNFDNLIMVKKPLYTLNEAMIFNRETIHHYEEENETVRIDFTAPDAEILVVDDNSVNLTIAEGLLEPLQMKIDTALSGKEAIAKISKRHYDLIFMDHMMPELDGVETTRIIRRFHKEYHDVPILALTANAMDGVKEMFLDEGMNDFVAKPIEMKTLVAKVKQWLPVEKIHRLNSDDAALQKIGTEKIIIGDLDTEMAVRLLGSTKLFWNVLKEYYRVIDKKSQKIQELMEEEAWADYTIEVHALKSASKQIGAIKLSDEAAAMERAGNARDKELIRENTGALLQHYRSYKEVLEPFFVKEEENNEGKQEISSSLLNQLFAEMRDALENLDFDRIESAVEKMGQYKYEDWQAELYNQLKEFSEDMDVDGCEQIIEQWEQRREI
jgi:signal transduction histidine kinase/response regulator of citrate/malate metabolism